MLVTLNPVIDKFKEKGIMLEDSVKWGDNNIGTFNGFYDNMGYRIDYIFYQDNGNYILAGEYDVIDEKTLTNQFVSDHFPVHTKLYYDKDKIL